MAAVRLRVPYVWGVLSMRLNCTHWRMNPA